MVGLRYPGDECNATFCWSHCQLSGRSVIWLMSHGAVPGLSEQHVDLCFLLANEGAWEALPGLRRSVSFSVLTTFQVLWSQSLRFSCEWKKG